MVKIFIQDFLKLNSLKKYYIEFKNKDIVITAAFLIMTCIFYNVVTSKRFYSDKIGGDQELYHSIALGILECKDSYDFYGQSFDIGTDVTPFFPCIVATSYLFGGIDKQNLCNLNIILNCLTILIIYLTLCLIKLSRRISLLFSIVFLFYYPLWKMNFSILMEVSTVFLLSFSIFLFFYYLFHRKSQYLYSSLITFSILVLVNNRFVVLLLSFFLLLLFKSSKNLHDLKREFFLPFIIVLVIISPWFFRQYIEYKQFVFFTPLWHNVVSDKLGIFEKIDVKTASTLLGEGTAVYSSNYGDYLNSMKSTIADDQLSRLNNFTIQKFEEVKLQHNQEENIYAYRFKRYFNLYDSDFHFEGPSDYRLIPPSSNIYRLVQLLILLPIFILSIFALIISILKNDFKIIFLSILFFSHLFLHIIIHYNARYRLTIMPVLLIMAAYGFSELLKMVKASSQKCTSIHYHMT